MKTNDLDEELKNHENFINNFLIKSIHEFLYLYRYFISRSLIYINMVLLFIL